MTTTLLAGAMLAPSLFVSVCGVLGVVSIVSVFGQVPGGALALGLIAWLVVCTIAVAELQVLSLSYFQVTAPGAVLEALEYIQDTTSVRFPRVMVLADRHGIPPLCDLQWRVGNRACLIVSASLLTRVHGEHLHALLIHEAAHLRLRHLGIRSLVVTLSLSVTVAISMVAPQKLGAILGTGVIIGLGVAIAIAIAATAVICGLIYRHQEAEADAFAAGKIGARVLIDALRKVEDYSEYVTSDTTLVPYALPRALEKRLGALRLLRT